MSLHSFVTSLSIARTYAIIPIHGCVWYDQSDSSQATKDTKRDAPALLFSIHCFQMPCSNGVPHKTRQDVDCHRHFVEYAMVSGNGQLDSSARLGGSCCYHGCLQSIVQLRVLEDDHDSGKAIAKRRLYSC